MSTRGVFHVYTHALYRLYTQSSNRARLHVYVKHVPVLQHPRTRSLRGPVVVAAILANEMKYESF